VVGSTFPRLLFLFGDTCYSTRQDISIILHDIEPVIGRTAPQDGASFCSMSLLLHIFYFNIWASDVTKSEHHCGFEPWLREAVEMVVIT
jgi:hypothetical protein